MVATVYEFFVLTVINSFVSMIVDIIVYGVNGILNQLVFGNPLA